MQHRVVGLFSYPWNKVFTVPRNTGLGLMGMYRWAVWFKANPRSEEYMRALFAERFPQGEFINVNADHEWQSKACKADTMILLYPDAIGLGFHDLERNAQRVKKTWTEVRALTGRRREFLLNRATFKALRFRRFIEMGMVGEMAAIPLFVLFSPLLLVVDWARGRR